MKQPLTKPIHDICSYCRKQIREAVTKSYTTKEGLTFSCCSSECLQKYITFYDPYSAWQGENYIMDGLNFFAVYDRYPVRKGHILIVSKAIKNGTLFDLTREEFAEFYDVLQQVEYHIRLYYSPDGFNVGMNCGHVAGQTVSRFHCHVIPRYAGDVDNPKGGVRNLVSNPLVEY